MPTPRVNVGENRFAVVWLASQGPHIYGLSVPQLAPAFTHGVGTQAMLQE